MSGYVSKPKVRAEIIDNCREVKYPYGMPFCKSLDEPCDRVMDAGKCKFIIETMERSIQRDKENSDAEHD